MKRSFIIYDKRTGAIGEQLTCKASLVNRQFMKAIGGDVVNFGRIDDVVADGRTQFVDVEMKELRPREPFDLAISGNSVSGVPEGTEILFLFDRSRTVMDASGVLELDVDYPETVKLELRHPRFVRETIEVACT